MTRRRPLSAMAGGTRKRDLLFLLGGLLIEWLVISAAVFRFRHPWVTETEVFLHMLNGDVLLLKGVDYEDMRPRRD